MRNRNHAIDVRILVTVVKRKLRYRRNLLRFVTRAHARRNDQHKISCAYATITTAKTHERLARRFGNVVGRRCVQRIGQVSHERHVVRHVRVSDLLAAKYSQRRPDWLAKLSHKLACRNVARGKAMSRRHGATKLYD